MKRIIILIFLVIFAAWNSNGMVATGYTWAQNTGGTYTTVSGGTLVASGAALDDNTYAGLPIGFTFYYEGNAYTQFGVADNGYIQLGGGAIASYHGVFVVSMANSIAAYCGDLQGTATAELRYVLSGTAPNQVLTIQWKDFRFYADAETTANFQIKLYESSGTIELDYGSCLGSTSQYVVQVGISGTVGTDFNIRAGYAQANAWTTTLASPENGYGIPVLNTWYPPSGLVYSWTQVAPGPALVSSPANGATGIATTATLNWTAGPGGTASGYKVYFGTDNPPTNIADGTIIYANTYDPTPDMVFNTTYFWKIVPFNGGGTISTGPIWSFTLGPDQLFSSAITAKKDGIALSNADIYVDRNDGQGFQNVGKTGSNGDALTVSNLKVGDKMRATKLIHTKPAVKEGHELVDNTMFELWVDSDLIGSEGEYTQRKINSQQASYTLNCMHSIYKYNLVLSATWVLDDDYYDKLVSGLKEASRLLYNTTDGQAYFNKVVIFDGNTNNISSDIILHENVDINNCNEVEGIDFKWKLWPILPSQLHMHRLHHGHNQFPNQHDWYYSLVHEFGHYGFGQYDEYLNGLGNYWNTDSAYWRPGEEEHPNNYGMMQTSWTSNETEQSSSNDYLISYPFFHSKASVTMQYDKLKMSCWNRMKTKWQDYFVNNDVIMPLYGWYPELPPYDNGCSYRHDRLGPDDPSIGDKTLVVDQRSGKDKFVGAHNNIIKVQKDNEPLAAAQITELQGNKKIVLGKTDIAGLFDITSTYLGDSLLISKVSEGKFLTKKIQINSYGKIETVELADKPASKKSNVKWSADPGVMVDVNPHLQANSLTLNFDLYFDQALAIAPKALLRCGNISDSITFAQEGTLNKYKGSSIIDLLTTDFDGTGNLEITLQQGTNAPITFLSEFSLFSLDSLAVNMIFNKGFNLNIDKSNIFSQELGISLATYYLPYGSQTQLIYPITDMFTVKSGNTNTFSEPAGLNIDYTEAEVTGYDESTIGLYKWNLSNLTWEAVLGFGLGTQDNFVTALTTSTGTFCVFATSQCSDTKSPGSINDLNATPGEGQAMVNLSWTSPGDDNNSGQATDYLIRFSEDSITSQNWDQCKLIGAYIKPAPAGTSQSVSIKMPNQNHLYYVAIKTVDKCGNLSEFSNLAYTTSSLQKYTFSLLSPGFNEKINTFEPTLTWEKPEVNDTLTYVLIYADNTSFSNAIIVTGIDTSEYKITSGINNLTTYYWKVLAKYQNDDTIFANQPYYIFSTSSTYIEKYGNNISNNLYCYPNPFIDIVNIGYTLESANQVNLTVYNLQGKPISTLVNSTQSKGEYKFQWSPDVPSGVYYCTLRTKDATTTRKIVLIR